MNEVDVVNAIIESRGVKISWLAKKLGVSRQDINYRFRCGKNVRLKVETLVKTLNALDYDLVVIPKTKSDYILGKEDSYHITK